MRSTIFLTEESIRNRCRTQATYNQGLAYFEKGSVREIRVLQDHKKYQSIVQEQGKVYTQRFEFNKHGILERSICDCEDFAQTPGHCHHAVAALLALRDHLASDNRRDLNSGIAVQRIMESWGHAIQPEMQTKHRPLRVEWTLIYQQSYYGGHKQYHISMKIGDERMYVVHAIDRLLDAISAEKALTFTSKFSYLPKKHCFSVKDLQVIQMLQEIRELNRLLLGSSNNHTQKVFYDKKVRLTPALAMRFLKIMQGSFVSVKLPDRELDKVPVFAADLPIQFTLSEKSDNVALQVDYYGRILPLFDGDECFIYNDMIYIITERQQSILKSLQLVFTEKGAHPIDIPREYQDVFISGFLNFAGKHAKVHIEHQLQERINREPLQAKAYLDYREGSLYCDLQFHYGETVINPYAMDLQEESSNSLIEESSNSLITVRDLQSEQYICQLFNQWQFQQQDGQLFLTDEHQLFVFITEYLQILQDHVQVYSTASFQMIQKLRFPDVRGKLRVNRAKNMLEISFDTSGIEASELPSIFAAIKEKKPFYRLRDGAYVALSEGNDHLKDMAHSVEILDLKKKDFAQDRIQLPLYKALLLDETAQERGNDLFDEDEQFREFVCKVREFDHMEHPLPESMQGVLRPYQVTGYHWFRTLEHFGFGGILADDMGLGKTLQAISFIVSLKERSDYPAIVIAPTSLIYNWQNEIATFAPELSAVVIAGNQSERRQQMEGVEKADVIITSYPLVRRDFEQYAQMSFSVCILDEAQFLKNPVTQTAQAVKMIEAKSVFALTGTPIENSLTDLWSIFDCILPGYFPPLQQFQRIYEQDNLKDLHKRLAPFILRRLKKDVLEELPEKIENRYISVLTHEQKKIYLAYLEQIKGNVGKIFAQGTFSKNKIEILAALTRLRQICCHPGLFVDGYTGGSGKLLQLIEIVEESLAGGHRLLIFSQFSSMLKIIRTAMEEHRVRYFYLDGSTPAAERMEMADKFNQGEKDVFLISLKAGGAGLNLTGADMVILYDLWWNPAVEDQAADRAHRIGQQKVVQVIRMIAQGTIEEKIYQLQQEKRNLVDQIIRSGETLLTKLSEAEIRDLLEM